jgi:hypothetical protein
MTDDKPTCDLEATFDDGSLVCVREPGRHIRHKAANGTVFIQVGNGFAISELHR